MQMQLAVQALSEHELRVVVVAPSGLRQGDARILDEERPVRRMSIGILVEAVPEPKGMNLM